MSTATKMAPIAAAAAWLFLMIRADGSDLLRTTFAAWTLPSVEQQSSKPPPATPSKPPDPMDVYLAALPVTDADFPALRSEDARVWTEFFNSFGDNISTLRAEVQRSEVEVGAASSALKDADARISIAAKRSSQAAAALETAVAAHRRAQQRSGGAVTAELQRHEDSVERAREVHEQVRSEEEAVRDQVVQLETQRTRARAQREEVLRALERATRNLGAPALDAIAKRQLKLGNQVVTVIKHSRVDDRIGVAECDGTRPIIVIAQRPTQSFAYAVLLFFREHELAHHTLGHIDCSKGKSTRSGGPEQELEADCAAARVLDSFPDGRRVIDIVFGHLFAWAFPQSQTHPSTRARANALFSACT
jgi:hypothetical protein